MNRIQKLLGALTLFFAAGAAQGSVVLNPAFMYRSQHIVDNTGSFSNVEDRYTVFDIHAGYLFDDIGVVAGALLQYEADGFINGDLRGLAIGPSVSWVKDAFIATLTYHLTATKTFNVGGAEKKLLKGHGVQIDVAWVPEISPGFGLGPQLTWQSLTYDRSKIGPSEEKGDGYEDTTVTPGLAFWWKF